MASRGVSIEKVVVASLVLVTLLAFIDGRGPHLAPPRPVHPPTPAALAFQAQQAELRAREAAALRQAEAARAAAEPTEEESVLPYGPGRAETFGYCIACHSTAIIRRSAFNREQWDGLMDWMTEKHGMTRLEGELRVLIVDYLTQQFGPRQVPARARSPFLN